MSINRWIILAILAAVAGWGLPTARADESPQIIGIDRREAMDRSADTGASLMKPRLPKFTEAMGSSPREVFQVRWRAPGAGLPAGTMLTFEYRQAYSDRVRFLSIRYPFAVRGERTATFEVTGEARRTNGHVTAWRARVVLGGRALAEQVSPSWK